MLHLCANPWLSRVSVVAGHPKPSCRRMHGARAHLARGPAAAFEVAPSLRTTALPRAPLPAVRSLHPPSLAREGTYRAGRPHILRILHSSPSSPLARSPSRCSPLPLRYIRYTWYTRYTLPDSAPASRYIRCIRYIRYIRYSPPPLEDDSAADDVPALTAAGAAAPKASPTVSSVSEEEGFVRVDSPPAPLNPSASEAPPPLE